MTLLGLRRVIHVYPVWTIIYAILLGIMVYFRLQLSWLLFLLTIIFLVKTLLLDYKLLKIKRKRVYWLDHGPFNFLVALIGLFGLAGFESFRGFVDWPTTVLSVVGFLLDFIKDLKENPQVYFK